MPSFARELLYSARSLRRSPGLVFVSVLALSVGIGLTTMMFSIIYGALLKGLNVDRPEQIVAGWRERPSRGERGNGMPIQDVADLRAQARSLEGLAFYTNGTMNVAGKEKAERYLGSWVTANTFRVLRVQPILGRDLRDGEDRPGGEKVAVISYKMWQNRFAGSRDVLGTTIRVNAQEYVVVGVMPQKFGFPENSDLWLPLQDDPLKTKRGEGRWVNVVGRLKDGVSADAASTELAGLSRRLESEYKETNEGVIYSVIPFTEAFIPKEPRTMLWTMLGAVFMVLLIACANVTNLLLDRAAHRTKEVGIRTALGASRFAIVRQFLVEALLLSAAGTVLGIGIANAGVSAFNRSLVDVQPPSWVDIRLHPQVLLFTIAVAIVASLVAGAMPAMQAARADINDILKDDSRGSSSFKIGRMSKALVMFEIALSCALLVAAGLMIKSVAQLKSVDYGFTKDGIYTARLGFPDGQADTVHQRQFFEQLEPRLAALPGAQGAAISTSLPGTSMNGSNFALEGATYATDQDYPQTSWLQVSSGFFDTYEVPIRQGRGFTAQDRGDNLPVAIVNQAFVDKHFAGQSPLGRRIRFGNSKSTRPWMTIVGVVPNLFVSDEDDPRPAGVYVPLAQNPSSFVNIAVRASGGAPMSLSTAVRDVVHAIDPDVPLYRVASLQDAIARSTWFVSVFGTLFMIFGFVALFLAAVGLYAVMAFSVSRRTREVGIRMALGAQSRDVVGLIFRQGVWQIGIGMVVGLALAMVIGQGMTAVLFNVKPRDPVIFAVVVLVLGGAALLATFLPAKRATLIDPLVALRAD